MAIPNSIHIPSLAEHKQLVEMLYETDEDFKTLLDDYITSMNTLESFKGKSLEDELEYKQLSAELKKEILDYVQNIS